MKTNLKTSTLALAVWLLAALPAPAFFDPTIGRWASRDPVGERGGDNTYGLVANCTVAQVDRLGLMTLSHLGEGFQFVPGNGPFFWLGIYSRFGRADYQALGGSGAGYVQAFVVSRAKLTWSSLRRCQDNESFSGVARAFFLDAFTITSDGTIPTFNSRATPVLTDRLGALYFNPINTTFSELFRCSKGKDLTGSTSPCPTEGKIHTICASQLHRIQPWNDALARRKWYQLAWKARLLASVPGLLEGFSDGATRGDNTTGPAPFGYEANHKWVFVPATPDGSDCPAAWTEPPRATVSYDMEFEWSDCGSSKKRRFTASPVLPAGLQRLDKHGNERGPAAGGETYRLPFASGY